MGADLTKVREVRVVCAEDESADDESVEPSMPARAADLVEVEVLPAEPCTSHRRSLPRLPSRFRFPKSSASRCSMTNVYCHMPETRSIAAAESGGQAQLRGTRLEWKLHPNGRLEVSVGPPLTEEEEEAQRAEAKDATNEADTKGKEGGSPATPTPEAKGKKAKAKGKKAGSKGKKADTKGKKAGTKGKKGVSPTSPGSPTSPSSPGSPASPATATPEAASASPSPPPSRGGGSKAESVKPDRTWSFALRPREPVCFEVTLRAKTEPATRRDSAVSVRILDAPAAGTVGTVSPRRPSLPAYVVRRRSIVPGGVAEQEESSRPCVECVGEIARRLADFGSCRINVVTRSGSIGASFGATRAVARDSGGPDDF
ncbi:uncharacterized protein [Dermacentor albipictus]|uniref:uncharacterized protein n=1 Tax=Dermacentor albipictus TaxID=60249 RepID=UPI0038FD10DB